MQEVYSILDEKIKNGFYAHLPYLEERIKELDKFDVCYAFVKDKNCALNALRHVGYKYTLSIDISDFFSSITTVHLKGLIKDNIVEDCFIDGAPQQGLPTSPLIANIALIPCDQKIINALKTIEPDCVYTRYADDLIFSFDNIKSAIKIKIFVEQILQAKGFKINSGKTKLQNVKNGRIIINGIGVDETGIYATRKTKKKLRAAIHQFNLRSARGLNEWSKCKLPKRMVI